MNLTVNGEPRQFDAAALTVAQLVDHLGLTGRRVAVEVNESVVPRARHGDHTLADGDAIEIVQFVGGGA